MRNYTYDLCCQAICLLISQGSFWLSDIDDIRLFISLCEWSRKIEPSFQYIRCKAETNHDLVIVVFVRFVDFTLFDLDWPFLLRLSIHLCHNFVPKGSSLPMSPASVNCWGSGSVTDVTEAGLNIHLVPSTDTNTSPSLSTSNTFPVRPRIYKWNKTGYYPV